MDKKKLAEDMQKILDICKDGAEGYEKAAEKIEYNDLKTLFLRLSQQRKLFIEQIKDEVLKLGIELNTDGTIKGFFHRAWLGAKATLGTTTNENVIEESMNGEQAAIETYNKVLTDPALPSYLHETLAEQHFFIKTAIKQLSDTKKEVA